MEPERVLTFGEFPEYLKARRSIPKYDATTESKVPHAWWDLDKTVINRLLNSFSEIIVAAVDRVPDNDRELKHLLRSATQLPQIERSPAIKVALLGAQGAGKSLLINAIFDCDGLSLTGADGAACTSSIVQYLPYPSGADDSSARKFFAEVKFLDTNKMEAMLQEHSKNYYMFQRDDIDSDDEEDVQQIRGLQLDECDRRLKDTAEDIFHTIFGSRERFLSSWSLQSFKDGEFVQLCGLKCQEAIGTMELNSQRTATFVATSQGDLLAHIKPFLTKVKGKSCLWPLVDSVSIRFSHDLLQQGIEIIDLPGMLDH